jgi:hypothetical protein
MADERRPRSDPAARSAPCAVPASGERDNRATRRRNHAGSSRLRPSSQAGFRRHRVRQAEGQMAARELWQDHGLIFASKVGTPMNPQNLSHSFARPCERAGLGHWDQHELRHSGALADAGLGDAAARGLRGALPSQYRHHQGRIRHLLEGDKRAARKDLSLPVRLWQVVSLDTHTIGASL